jgi:hypothetical protein
VAQTFGVVDIFVSRKPPEHGLPSQPERRMAAVLAGTCISERATRHHAEAEGAVEFAISQQSSVGSAGRASKLEYQPPIEIEPERAIN